MFSRCFNSYSFVLGRVLISPIVIPLVGDFIISRDNRVVNGERATTLMTDIFSKKQVI